MPHDKLIESELQKTQLLSTCTTCGKKSGMLPNARLTGWIFGSSGCDCPVADFGADSSKGEQEPSADVDPASVNFPRLPEGYEIIGLIGQGGMGQVFQALDRQTGAKCAIKTMHKSLVEDRDAVKRFQQEVKAASQLDHSHIVSVLGSIESEDGPCLVMEYVDGVSLSKYLKKQGKLSEAQAIQLFMQIVDALTHAHKNGLLHRDLKPSNIMIVNPESDAPQVKVLDFGLAKVLPTTSGARDTQDLTKTGDVFGSPAYMSPEQCMGFKLDERSDIYSLGCLMYEVMAGHPPFSASNPIQVVVKQMSEMPASWTGTRDGGTLKGMEAIVFKCLAKEKEDRYQVLSELQKDLNHVQSGKKIRTIEKEKKSKAVMSGRQAVSLIFEIFVISIYWLLMAVPMQWIFSIIPALLLPFSLYGLVTHLKRFGLEGSAWKQWRLYSLAVYVLLSLTAIPTFVGHFVFYERLPTFYQYLFAVSLAVHLALIVIAFANRVGCFIWGGYHRSSFRRVSVQFGFLSLLLVSLSIVNMGVLSYLLPNLPSSIVSSVMGRSSLEHLNRPKRLDAQATVALALDPKCTAASTLLAQVSQELKQPEKALPYIDRTLNSLGQPNKDDLLELRADLLLQQDQPHKALRDLNESLKIRGSGQLYSRVFKIGDLYIKRGYANLLCGNYQQAIEDFDDGKKEPLLSTKYDPDTLRTIACFKMGDTKKAIDILSNSVKANEYHDSGRSLLKRAILYESIGAKDLAGEDYESVTKMPIENREVESLHMAGELGAYVQFLQYMIKLEQPEDASPQFQLLKSMHIAKAYAYEQLAAHAKAEQELKTANASSNEKKEFLEQFFKLTGLPQKW